MGGHIIIVTTGRVGDDGKPVHSAFAIAESSRLKSVAAFKLRPGHTADDRVEAVAELSQAVVNALGLRPGEIKLL